MQRELLEILIRHPQCLALARETLRAEQLGSRRCRAIFETLCRLSDAGQTPTFDRLMLEFDDPAIKSLLVDLEEVGSAKGVTEPEAVLKQWISAFRREQAQGRQASEGPTLEKTLEVLMREERARRGIPEPTDG
jgi:hypothetical protein